MVSRFMEMERKTMLVQFIAVQPLTFYATSDGTDLVQDILKSQLARSDADIFGQEGSLSIDDNAEFLTFEPTDTKNRTLHLPIEHLAYCGALRRMRRDTSDQRNPDQIQRRDFENVDLANRYAHLIIGPPIFVAVFHGFDNALCYTFVTQNADDACLLVMKLMRAFRQYEQQLVEQQGQINQGTQESPPLHHSSNTLFTDNRQILSSPTILQLPPITSNMYAQNLYQDDFIQQLLSNPNLQIVNQPYSSSTPIITQHIDRLPIISAPPPPSVCYPTINSPSTIVTQQNSPVVSTMLCSSGSTGQLISGTTPSLIRPPSPPIFDVSNAGLSQSLSVGNTLPPQVIYKPNNQEINYKQKVIIRWLKPPTPPPQAPIIIREIQCPPEIPPPIIYRQAPLCPPTPPPIIVREQPPPCPQPGNPVVIEKRLPRVCLPRQIIVEQCPPPPPKPQAIIYEKYLPPPPPPQRQVIVQRNACQSTVCTCACSSTTQQAPCRRLVREVIRQVPQQCTPAQPAVVCTQQNQQKIIPGQSQVVQQFVPVFAQRQHIVQPKGVRVIRQVIGPAQSSGIGQAGIQPQMYPTIGQTFI